MDWLRLWHDMPNDPKWRTISRSSGEPISVVLAVYVHLLVDASQGVTRCHEESRVVTRGVTDVTDEDIASALDVTEDAIRSIRQAMQGRVLDGDQLTGWEKRQPKKEDAGNPETGAKSATERKREQRERERLAKESSECHNESRNVTECHDRLDKRREEEKQTPRSSVDELFAEFWAIYPRKDSKKNALKAYQKINPNPELHARILAAVSVAKASRDWMKDGGQFIPHASTWLNAARWEDEPNGLVLQAQNRFAGAK